MIPSAIGTAATEFLRLQAAERVVRATDDEGERRQAAATEQTDAALARLLALPAQTGAQAAIKLSVLASQYPLAQACGIPPEAVGLVVSDAVRFLAAAHIHVGSASPQSFEGVGA